MISSFFAALQFLTIFPVSKSFDKQVYQRSIFWFPFIGLLIGLTFAILDRFVFAVLFPVWTSSLLVVFGLLIASGGLHADGLADSADGLFSARPRKRILEIMRDSRIGTMGVLALLFFLQLKFTGLAEMIQANRFKALILAPLSGRCAMLLSMAILPYARKSGGLVDLFPIYNRKQIIAFVITVWIAFMILCSGWQAFSLWAFCGITFTLFSIYILKKIRGLTGDTLGAICEITEAQVILFFCITGT